MQYVVTFIVLVNIIFVTGQFCDQTECKNYRFEEHYRDLNCEPIYESRGCCPTRYDCPAITQMSEQRDKCHYHDKVFEQDDTINKTEGLPCRFSSCVCKKHEDEHASFECKRSICYEPPIVNPQIVCREKHSFDKCCPEYLCNEDTSTLKNCTFNNETYTSGQIMYTVSERCHQCICEDNGIKTCKKFSCDLQIHNSDELIRSCAPAYFGELECCPDEFICPAKERIIRRYNSTNTDQNKMCKFGTDLLQINDEIITRERHCLQCKCMTPPLVTCKVSAWCK